MNKERLSEVLKKYSPNEKYSDEYSVEDGTYSCVIEAALIRYTSKGNQYVGFRCRNLDKMSQIIFVNYYLTDLTYEESICKIRNFMFDCGIDDFNESDFDDETAFNDKLSTLIGKKCKVTVSTKNDYQNSFIYRDIDDE